MDYFLTEEQQMIREIVAKIATEKVRPVRAELDESEEFPWEIMKILAQSDLCGLYLPEEYGGLGGGVLENCLAIEEMGRACIAVATTFAASGLGAYPILLYGSEEQKQKYLPPIASRPLPSVMATIIFSTGPSCGSPTPERPRFIRWSP